MLQLPTIAVYLPPHHTLFVLVLEEWLATIILYELRLNSHFALDQC